VAFKKSISCVGTLYFVFCYLHLLWATDENKTACLPDVRCWILFPQYCLRVLQTNNNFPPSCNSYHHSSLSGFGNLEQVAVIANFASSLSSLQLSCCRVSFVIYHCLRVGGRCEVLLSLCDAVSGILALFQRWLIVSSDLTRVSGVNGIPWAVGYCCRLEDLN
jgi:hypothetical protein